MGSLYWGGDGRHGGVLMGEEWERDMIHNGALSLILVCPVRSQLC